MTKEEILNNHWVKATIISILIAFEIIVFRAIYGLGGIVIGMLMGLGANTLLVKDFTYHPFKNLLKFIAITISIGLFPYLSQINIYIGVLINFGAVFCITYLLVYNLKTHIYHPFMLTYVYMLGTKLDFHTLPLRLSCLFLGAFFIMLLQFIFNNGSAKKLGNKYLKLLSNSLLLQLESYKVEKFNEEEFNKFKVLCEKWANALYERKDSYFYLDKSENSEISLIINIEKFSDELKKIHTGNLEPEEKEKIFSWIEDYVLAISKLSNKNQSFDELNSKLNFFCENINNLNRENQCLYRIVDFADTLTEKLKEFKGLSDHKEYINTKHESKNNQFNFITILKSNLTRNSLRFNFAFKVAVVVATIEFVISYAHISHGKWVLIATYALLTPFTEDNGKLALERLFGSFFGAIAFIIITIFIPRGIDAITLVVVITIYLTNLTKSNYTVKMLLDCLLSLSFAALTTETSEVLAFNKLECIIVAIIVSIVCNFAILPYRNSDNIKNIVDMYHKMSHNLLKNLFEKSNLDEFRFELKNTILKSKVMENKILLANTGNSKRNVTKFVEKQRDILDNSYILMRRLYKNNYDEETLKNLTIVLKEYFESKDLEKFNSDEVNNIISDGSKEIFDKIKQKQCYSLLCDIIESNKESNILREEII